MEVSWGLRGHGGCPSDRKVPQGTLRIPSGNMFGKIPRAENKTGEWSGLGAENSRGFTWLLERSPPDLLHGDPALTHLSSDNRPWLQQVWLGRNAPEDFALRSRAVSIMWDSSNPVLPKVPPERHADEPADPRRKGEQLLH